jgi:DNA-binding NarL/FixJ family response regulator
MTLRGNGIEAGAPGRPARPSPGRAAPEQHTGAHPEVLILSDRPFVSTTFAEQAAAQGLATSTYGLTDRLHASDPAVRRSTWIVADVCGDPAAAVARCRALAPADAHLVLLITCERSVSSADLAELLTCRPAAVLGAGLSPAELVLALEMVHDGHMIVHVDRSGSTGRFLQLSLRQGARTATASMLNQQERELLGLVARGVSDDEIARRLFVSEATVRRRVAALRKRTSTAGRVELAAWAGARGYYEEEADSGPGVSPLGLLEETPPPPARESRRRNPVRRAFALVSAPGLNDALAATAPLLSA